MKKKKRHFQTFLLLPSDPDKVMLGQVMRVAKDQEANEARSQATSDALLNTMGLNSSIKPTPEKEPSKPLPPNCPPWAARLKDVEVSKLSSIGKRYWYVEVHIWGFVTQMD